ncbi:MAG: Biopolymer transport protein ExbD [Pseudomonadota bacterium]|jgi:biopolymer transport protein TolR
MPSVVSSRGRSRRAMSDINMVPFIDVMLVLLIIFMVTAPLMTPSMIDVPSVGKAAAAPEMVLTIEIEKNGKMQLRQKSSGKTGVDQTHSVTLDNVALQAKLMQGESDQIPVIISADKTLPYEKVMQVMDKLQRANVKRIGLSVRTLD